MKISLWLIGGLGVAFSFSLFAENETRLHKKCYLQIENQTKIVHQFVSNLKSDRAFIDSLSGKDVFMADGKTKQKITSVYECVDMKARFNSREAAELEKNTAF